MSRPPLPPFDARTARQKVRLAEDAWNSCDPDRVTPAYSDDSLWRNRSTFLRGHREIHAFLTEKWRREREYRLIKEIWSWSDAHIAVRFAYEWCDAGGQWVRSYGNENWAFGPDGRMNARYASINDVEIAPSDRLFLWKSGTRPKDHPGLTALGL